MEPEHAFLAASDADRWMECTAAPRAAAHLPNEETTFALEGTIAHAVAEAIQRSDDNKFNIFAKKLLKSKFREDFDKYFGNEMLRHAEDFVNYINERTPEKCYSFIEYKLDTSSHIPEGFGTADRINIYLKSDDGKRWYWVVETFDLKYGKGVPVSAIGNRQQKIYALGVINDFGHIFPIEKVIMHIYQPRIQNNSHDEISVAELLEWGEKELRPKALLAFNGEGDFKPGPKQCKFCPLNPTCRALADYNAELAKYEFKNGNELSDNEILDIYEREDLFVKWLEKLHAYVLSEAVKGKKWPGYKLVHGRADRYYKDKPSIINALGNAGFKSEDYLKPRELFGLGELENNIGVEAFNKIVVPFIGKPPGKPTLAPEDSKKPEYNPAAMDFEVYKEETEDYII